MSEDYKNLKGYEPDADLGVGCGLPTQYANIKKGDTVIDLGSGAGNDCFIARSEVGESGKVIGIDFAPQKNIIFKEIYRVLKPGGHFCISDVVLNGIFPKEFTDNAAMYAGCIASAIQKEDYLAEIEKVNFKNIRVERTKTVIIPDEVLYEHLDENTIQ